MQLTTQPTSRAEPSVSVDRESARRAAAPRTTTSPRCSASWPSARSASSCERAGGRHPVAVGVPHAGVGRRGTRRGPRRRGATTARRPGSAGRPSRGASRRSCARPRRCARGRRVRIEARSLAPAVDVGDRGELQLRGVGVREPAAAAHGVDRAARAPARPMADVDHRQAGAHDEHVAAARTRSRRTTSRAPGAHGSGTKNAERRRPSGAQACPAAGSPVATTTPSAATSLPSSRATEHALRGAGHAGRAAADVAQAHGSGARGQRLLEGLGQVAGELPARRELVAAGSASSRLAHAERAAPPADEVAGLLGERAHAGGRHVEQVPLVGGAEGDARPSRSAGSTTIRSRPVERRPAARTRCSATSVPAAPPPATTTVGRLDPVRSSCSSGSS